MVHSLLKRFLRWILKLFFLLFVVLGAFLGILGIQYYQFRNQPVSLSEKEAEKGLVFVVEPGASTSQISNSLQKAGLIQHPRLFVFFLQWEGYFGTLKAGEYLVTNGMTPRGIMELLASGKVIQYPLTVVPGWTFDRLMENLNTHPKIHHTLVGLSREEVMKKLGFPGEHPEGRFFPETYHFPSGTQDITFLKRAYKMLQDKLSGAWEKRDPKIILKTPYEALILASIIEKESDVKDEYADIAGVYSRRLEKKMLLQADPTVIYGLGKEYTGTLTGESLRKPSPYNTYLNTGLPPTPIALPSLKAIEAALHPKEGDTLYFVAKGNKKGQGHTFSSDKSSHDAAVLEYRNAIKNEG